jgi:hypothetical protein
LEAGERVTWTSIRNLFERNTEAAVSEFSDAAVSFSLHSSEIDTKLQRLREHARNLLEMKAREVADAGRVLMRMKDRYITSLLPSSFSILFFIKDLGRILGFHRSLVIMKTQFHGIIGLQQETSLKLKGTLSLR